MKESTRKVIPGIVIVLLICIAVAVAVYLFTPIGTGRISLSDRQVESLCSAFAGYSESEEGENIETTCQAAVKIFGVAANGELRTIYGYVSQGEYLKHKDKAYEVSGGNWAFMVDVEIQGDDVKIVREYGDGVSSETTYDEMPFRYRFQISNYDAFDASGYCKLGKIADKKAKKELGVPVETKYTLSIDGDSFEIYDMDAEGNVDVIEKGKVKDL